MEYFDLPTSTSSSSSSTASQATGWRGTQHATITLEEGEENVPTPVGTPLDHPNAISISTAFHPSLAVDDCPPDIIIVSSDNVHFYTHRHRLLAASANRMGNLIPSDDAEASATPITVAMPHPSPVVNIILHTMYGQSCVHYLPTLEMVEVALDALALSYGVPIQPSALPNQPIYTLLLSFAPYRPLDAYAVAGKHGLEEAAVAISSHLLAYDLARLPDSVSQKMGALYLKRLFLLHQSRLIALRNILYKPPATHPPTVMCNEVSQQRMLRAWAFAVAQLVWDVLPSASTSALQALLEPVGAAIDCPYCLAALHRRVQEVVYEWSAVKSPDI
ncbi:hypothetical protein BD310DRAFT_944728 [Dichomitus squalens]|uniref:BTB domain-containing protein n=1 Tax=Dichomitus squalens TaxID=114155 RepID=A0A4Q9Q8U1_9APHY|nr:hypothetical protein BD310DRAFT_944728 [Dichomitus squalens]